ncbi:MAG: ATP-grasp domain-containing protein [Chloroflexi bacterium]|nr:MAG: ATP-grasp domain-containing protein [Chloroflexota bacterium]
MLDENGRFRRVLLLANPRSYRVQPFLDAAERLDIEAIPVFDLPQKLAENWHVELGVDFNEPDTATAQIVAWAQHHPVDAVLAVDDTGTLLAARVSQALGLPHNDVEAALAARDKHLMRRLLQKGGVSVPQFQLFSTTDDPQQVARQVVYPCVVKPTMLSGSRGVIRADDEATFVSAVSRLTRLLDQIESGPHPYLVESFIPGFEVALEGLLENGRLTVLALFDKPDPLDGPYFEETIYVTPSRLPQPIQNAIADCTAKACAALGLRVGPIHAELRVNEHGPWLIEVAGRSIGGLCSRTLRFGSRASLEELILRQACGLEIESTRLTGKAGGVMMIPIPQAGLLKAVHGCAEAESVPLIESVEITARLNYPLVPLPEGDAYLGFIFARGNTPEAVEAALRTAHSKLHFDIAPIIPLTLVT